MKLVLEIDLAKLWTVGRVFDELRAALDQFAAVAPKQADLRTPLTLHPEREFAILMEGAPDGTEVKDLDGKIHSRMVLMNAPFDNKKFSGENVLHSQDTEQTSMFRALARLSEKYYEAGD